MNRLGLTLISCLSINYVLFAEVRLPALFTYSMALQRESQVPIWGWSEADQTIKITVAGNSKELATKANSKGEWTVLLSSGGDYSWGTLS